MADNVSSIYNFPRLFSSPMADVVASNINHPSPYTTAFFMYVFDRLLSCIYPPIITLFVQYLIIKSVFYPQQCSLE